MNSVKDEPGENGFDLYDDILVEDIKCKQESLHEVEIKYQEALKRIAVLEEITRQNEADIVTLKKKNAYLMKNISVLYKTACTELERKKEEIKSLREKPASGVGYEYKGDCRSRIAPYPYNNMYEPQNSEDPRYKDESSAPYNNSPWSAPDPYSQFNDSHNFYSPHSSNYPNNAIASSDTDVHPNTQASQSSYSFSNDLNKDRSEKYMPHSKPHSHTAPVTESTDTHTPPIRNTDSHDNARDSSSHSRYSDKHTPHTKQTDSSVSHSKHSSSHLSSRRRSESKSSRSRHLTSKTPTPTPLYSDNRSSSSKRSHSDSRKHHPHRSGSRNLEPSLSKLSESKKSARSSRISSKDRETSSSSRSRQRRSRSMERGDTKPARSSHRSSSSDKYQDSQSNKQEEQKVKRGLAKDDENSATLKRKLPKEFSVSCESKSKSKRKHKEKSKLPEQNPSPFPEAELIIKSQVGEDEEKENDEEEEENNEDEEEEENNEEEEEEEKENNEDEEEEKENNEEEEKENNEDEEGNNDEVENLGEESPKYEDLVLQETDCLIDTEIKDNDADLHAFSVHASPSLTDQYLEREEDMPVEMVSSPLSDRPVEMAAIAVIESQSPESVTNEDEDTVIPAQKSASSTSENSSHESNVADTEFDAEKDLDTGEVLDIEIHDPCTSIMWDGNNFSDTDENGVEVCAVANEGEDSAIPAQKSASSTSESSSHESDVADTECHAEKDLDKCKELDIEIHAPCNSIMWTSKSLSDTDENGLEDGTASEGDKLDSENDGKKDDQSDPSSDHSDDKSDTSDEKKHSIVIQCFGDDGEDNSRSPILIPCYTSKKSKSCSSISDSDEECDTGARVTSTPSKSLISRSLFPVNRSSDMGENCTTPEDKADISALESSVNSTDKDEETIQEQSEEVALTEAAAMQPHNVCRQIQLDENLDFECSPILRKEPEDLDLTLVGSSSGILQNRDTKTATSGKEDDEYKSSSDNDNENCFRHITPIKSSDKNETCSEDELEEGEVLTDEENESDAATAAATTTTVRSPVRYKTSISPCRKTSAYNSYRGDSRKRPPREPMKSNPHNRQRVSPDQFMSKSHSPSVKGKQPRHRDGRSSQNRMHSSGSGSRSQSRCDDGHHRQSGFHYERKWSSGSNSRANRKRTY